MGKSCSTKFTALFASFFRIVACWRRAKFVPSHWRMWKKPYFVWLWPMRHTQPKKACRWQPWLEANVITGKISAWTLLFLLMAKLRSKETYVGTIKPKLEIISAQQCGRDRNPPCGRWCRYQNSENSVDAIGMTIGKSWSNDFNLGTLDHITP